MARDYGKVSPRFWTGETGRKLRKHPEAQTLALYLITAPGSTMTGIYYLAIPTAAHETGLTIPEVTAALEVLSDIGFAHYDEPNELVWVPSMAAWQIDDKLVETDKRVAGVRKEILFHQNHRFVVEFWNLYGEAFCLGKCPFVVTGKGLSSPLVPPSMSLGSQEQEHDQEQENPPPAPAIPGGAATDEPPPDKDDPLRPEKLFDRAMRRGDTITPHFLARMFGFVRESEIPHSLPWAIPKGVEKAQGVADICQEDRDILADVIPTMRLTFARAKAGIGDFAAETLRDPTVAFGCWCGAFTGLQEAVRGLTPIAPAQSARGNRATGPPRKGRGTAAEQDETARRMFEEGRKWAEGNGNAGD